MQKLQGLGGPSPTVPAGEDCLQGLGGRMLLLAFLLVILPFERAFLFSSQGMAFTLEERLQLGIHGLLPPCFLSQDVQVLRVMKNFENKSNDLDKYVKTILFPPLSPFNFQFFKAPRKT